MLKIHEINQAAKLLKSGAVLAHPADTCFGLTGDLMNPDVLKKIQKIKGRDAKKPMSIFLGAGSYELGAVSCELGAVSNDSKLQAPSSKLLGYALLSDFTKQICDQYFPGPITIVLPKGPKIPEWYFPETEWIGIRMVDDENVSPLLNTFGGPLITTSANFSGEPACYSVEEVEAAFEFREAKPDAILVGDIVEKKQPSTVIKIEDDRIEVLREGPVKIFNF